MPPRHSGIHSSPRYTILLFKVHILQFSSFSLFLRACLWRHPSNQENLSNIATRRHYNDVICQPFPVDLWRLSPLCFRRAPPAILVGEEGNAPTRTIGTDFTDPLVSLTIYSPRYPLRRPHELIRDGSHAETALLPLSESCHKNLRTL